MKKQMILTLLEVLSLVTPACVTEDPLKNGVQGEHDTFSQGCQQELTTFCKDVTPG